jgi:hypothetical protein
MDGTSTAQRGLRVAEVSVPTPSASTRRPVLAPARIPAGYRHPRWIVCDSSSGRPTGLQLRDIKDLLAIRDGGVCPSEPASSCCAADWLISPPKWLG